RLGLRERLVAVLAVVSVLTLALAAIALFSPLDNRLQASALRTLAATVRSEQSDFTVLSDESLRPGNHRLLRAARPLRRTGADVVVLDGHGNVLVSTDPYLEPVPVARAALRSGRPQEVITGDGSEAEAEVALPIKIDGVPGVLAARRPLTDVQTAT